MALLAVVVLTCLAATPLSGAASPVGPAGAPGGPTVSAAPRPTGAGFPTAVRHVYVIVLENERAATVLADGPFERYLAEHYAYANDDYAVCHPSAPNYLALTSGTPWQCGSDAYRTYSSVHLGDLAETAGVSWAAYLESMPAPCSTVDSYPYAVKHNPFVYYADVVTNTSRCAAHDLPLTAWNLSLAAGTLPALAYIVPNLLHDGHDTSVAYADRWLRGWLGPDLNASPFADSVFFVTYDESVDDVGGFNGTAGGHVYLAAVGPLVRTNLSLGGAVSHYDLLTTIEWLLGLGSTGHHDNASAFPPMESMFVPSRSPLTVQANASATSGPAPLATAFACTPRGGSPPYRYNWSFGDGAFASVADPSHTYLLPGVYPVALTVADSENASTRAALAVVVLNASSPVLTTILADPPHGPVPLAVRLEAEARGGTAPYHDSWGFGDGAPVSNGTGVEHTYGVPGNYTVTVRTLDALGEFGGAETTVRAYLTLGAVLALDRSATSPGGALRAEVRLRGGPAIPCAFAWALDGSPVGSNSSELNLTAPTAGAHLLSVVVTDAWGDRATANATLEVNASSPPGPAELPALPGFASAPLLGWGLLAGGVGAALAVWRLRRPPGSSATGRAAPVRDPTAGAPGARPASGAPSPRPPPR